MNTAYIHQLPLYKFTTSSAFRQHLCKKTLAVLGYVTPGKNIRNSYPQGYTENDKRRVNTIGKSKRHFSYHSTIFNVQRRLLWVVAVGGIIAVCTRNFVNFELGYGPVIGSFMGSFVVSLIAVKAVHWFHVPNHVLTIPSVIPMVPGVLMYRSLLALINMRGVVGEVTLAFSNGINSALIIFCIALGVAVPNIFARRYIAKDRQRFLTQMLAERRARGKFIEW